MSGFQDSQRPRLRFHRAIFIPEDEDEPRFIWVVLDRDRHGKFVVNMSNIGDFTDFNLDDKYDKSVVLGRSFGKTIHCGLRGRKLSGNDWANYGNPNRGLSKVDNELGKYLRGPILAVGIEYRNGVPIRPVNLDLVDFRYCIDELRARYDVAFRLTSESRIPRGDQCVRVSCKGDQFVLGYPQIETGFFPLEAYVTGVRLSQPAPRKLDLDLDVVKIVPGLSWHNRRVDKNTAAEENWPFIWLTSSFHEPPVRNRRNSQEHWDDVKDQGSFYVGRADGKELLPQHVQALTEYLSSKADERESNMLVLQDYLDLLSRKEFERFRAEWVVENANGEEVPSPYDM